LPVHWLRAARLILKPAEETPATAQELVRVLHDAGLPAGVLNMVFGVPAEVSGYLLDQPEVAKFSFTGSTAVGKMLASQAAKSMKRATLELGGHAPVIVWKDADIGQRPPMRWWRASSAMQARSASRPRAFMCTARCSTAL
jgi:succinate-semialdehyde dehydrogenase/glutarate-semialdehyde dehydrogenase